MCVCVSACILCVCGRVWVCVHLYTVLKLDEFLSTFYYNFRLYYRVGFISSFIETCVAMAEHGTDFNTIIDIVCTRRTQQFCLSEAQYWSTLHWYKSIRFVEEVDMYPCLNQELHLKLPSRKILSAAYLQVIYITPVKV